MSLEFCPDCQAECAPDSTQCGECGFPMQLTVVANGGRREIPPSQLDGWHRIVQVLQRSGVKVKTEAAGGWTRSEAWWALPVVGLFVLVITLLFGGALADAIWERPIAATPTLDLARNEDDGGDDGPDTSFLESAFEVTSEQQRLTENLNANAAELVDRTKVSSDVMEARGRDALLWVSVRDTLRNGLRVNEEGLFLMPVDHLQGAFQSEVRTVSRSGALVQETVFIVPEVGKPGDTRIASELVEKSINVGVALMRTDLPGTMSYPMDFNVDLSPNQKVWVSRYSGRQYILDESKVVDTYRSLDGILYWEIDGDLGLRDAGAPVFDEYGDLAGIFLHMEGRPVVLSLLRMREKTPYLYRLLR